MAFSFRPIADRVEGLEALDGPAKKLAGAVSSAIPSGFVKDALSGTWLGHPLHPLLTDVAIGAWTSSFMLDVVGGEETRPGADALIGLGILSAAPTAVSGLSDWSDLTGTARRVGLVHAAGNVLALSLFTLSYAARRGGKRKKGFLLSTMAMGAATFSAYLGGHLAYGKAVGVNQTAFQALPRRWTPVLDQAELAEGELIGATAGDADVLLYRRGELILAIHDRCTHRGCLLHDGRIQPDMLVECACHGSVFDLRDGSIVRGPATDPQPVFDARINEGKVEVRARS